MEHMDQNTIPTPKKMRALCLSAATLLLGVYSTLPQVATTVILNIGAEGDNPNVTWGLPVSVQMPISTPGLTYAQWFQEHGVNETGGPVFSSQVDKNATFYHLDSVNGFLIPSNCSCPCPYLQDRVSMDTSFAAVSQDSNGNSKVWLSVCAMGQCVNPDIGLYKWYWQARYFSGDISNNVPAKLEIGVIPTIGDYATVETFTKFSVQGVPGLLDLITNTLTWDTNQGGVDFSYSVDGGKLSASTSAELFWATGATVGDIISNAPPIFIQPIPAGTSGPSGVINVPAADLSAPPSGAAFILMVLNPLNLIAEASANDTIALPLPSIAITSVQTPFKSGNLNTFVSTDTITLQAKVPAVAQNLPVSWTVTSLQAAAGIGGFPSAEIHNADSQGISTFTFIPSANPLFLQNRQSVWTQGSPNANTPIGFEVTAKTTLAGQTLSTTLSMASIGSLLQDSTDILRQEYVDYQIPVPTRGDVVPSLGLDYNQGNYELQLSEDLPGHYAAVLGKYQSSTLEVDNTTYTVPANATLIKSSAYRNPQHNRYIGSVHPNSKHCYGRALDLVPVPISVPVNGSPQSLGLHTFWYPALAAAVTSAGYSPLPEKGATPVTLGDTTENHIHFQW
jgi:hypothetical protein